MDPADLCHQTGLGLLGFGRPRRLAGGPVVERLVVVRGDTPAALQAIVVGNPSAFRSATHGGVQVFV